MTTPVALTIAGSDSSGGAGIQADLKTFAALGVYGASAITALTAQNTRGVTGIHAVPAEFLRAQVDAVFGDLEVGDYAQEAEGSYISNVPAYTYTDATSSVPIAAHIATSKTDPTTATSQ